MADYDSVKLSKNSKEKAEKIMNNPKFPYNNLSLFLAIAVEEYQNEFNKVKSDPMKLGKWKKDQERLIEGLKKQEKVHKDARISWKG